MLYLLYGEDQFSLREEIEKLKTRHVPAEAADFNISKMDASVSGFNLDELLNTCESFPFLSDKRLVIAVDLLARLGKGGENPSATPAPKPARGSKAKAAPTTAPATPRERFVAFLGRIPETTVLVLVESKVAKNETLFKTVQKHGEVKEFEPPKGLQLEKWIQDRARKDSIKLEPAAATLLAQYLGSDLWRIENELQKLASYAGEGNPVRAEMVERMSAEVRDTPVFRLTESLARKNLREALVQLNRMRSETTMPRAGFSRYVFNSISRQVYDLIRVKELDAGRVSPAKIAEELRMHPFVAEKTVGLSRNFQASRLDWLYHRLTELDYADKSGRADLTSELELLLVEICAAN